MDNSYKTVRIIKVEKETSKVKNFYLETSIKASPGQYVMVWIPRLGEKPFAVGFPSPLLLSIAKVGPFTKKIHQLKKGDKITFRGPYGSSFKPKGRKMLFVGGGYGIVPLYFLAKTQKENLRKNIKVVIGAQTKSVLLYAPKCKKLGCQVSVATDDGSERFRGFASDLALKFLDKEKFDYIATCGPEPMMKKIAKICQERNIFCQVSLEQVFKCGGLGLCGECAFKGYLVCKDGPVFNGSILLR